MTKQTKLPKKEIANDLDADQDILINQVAELFSNPIYNELLATNPDKAIADFGLNAIEVYRLLGDPSKLSKVIKSRKVSS